MSSSFKTLDFSMIQNPNYRQLSPIFTAFHH